MGFLELIGGCGKDGRECVLEKKRVSVCFRDVCVYVCSISVC